ncbi:MAG: hypothetical protein WBE40_02660 [Thermoplasmata archaeon]
MANASTDTVRCTTCGTEFPATNSVEMQKHQGHPLVHIEQA